jgi:hypothetical protein
MCNTNGIIYNKFSVAEYDLWPACPALIKDFNKPQKPSFESSVHLKPCNIKT